MDIDDTRFDTDPLPDLSGEEIPESPPGFDSLVENAVDFLEVAVAEIEERPKYSVIHFCAGIELFLKARLLLEHWSLVVAKPGEVSREQFSTGDFESVSMRRAFERLEKICGENLNEERTCFLGLAEHRNRVVHFFHGTYAGKPDSNLVEQIVIEQLKAGVFLMRLLRHRWRMQFENHYDSIANVEGSLSRLRHYLKAKFAIIRSRLEAFKAAGGTVSTCHLCKMPAAEVTEIGALVKESLCLVCDTSRNHIRVQCPECNKAEVEFDVAEGTCPECDTSYDIDFLMEKFEAEGVAYCPECSYAKEHSVIEFGDGYLCVSCGNETIAWGNAGGATRKLRGT
jgi:ssDNA-binding Zn-finger/Zn-ribbon topoisomerase 1